MMKLRTLAAVAAVATLGLAGCDRTDRPERAAAPVAREPVARDPAAIRAIHAVPVSVRRGAAGRFAGGRTLRRADR